MEIFEPALQQSDNETEHLANAEVPDVDILHEYFHDLKCEGEIPVVTHYQGIWLAQVMERGTWIAQATGLTTAKGKPEPIHSPRVLSEVQQNPDTVLAALRDMIPAAKTAEQHIAEQEAKQRKKQNRKCKQQPARWQVFYTDGAINPTTITPAELANQHGFDFYDIPTDLLNIEANDEGKCLVFQSEQASLRSVVEWLECSQQQGQLTQELTKMILAAQNARNYMILANTGLVVSLATHLGESPLALEELIQEGNTGLVEGVSKFDHRRGAPLSACIRWWIRRSMLDALNQQVDEISLPKHAKEDSNLYLRLQLEMLAEHGERPSYETLAVRAGKHHSAEYVQSLLEFQQPEISIDDPAYDDGESDVTATEFLVDPRAEEPQRRFGVKEGLLRVLPRILTGKRDRTILLLRYGLVPDSNGDFRVLMPLDDIGQEFELAGSTVKQILKAQRQALRESADPGLRELWVD